MNYTCHELEQAVDPKAFFRIDHKVLGQISATQKISTYFNSRLKITCYGLNDEDCIVSRESVKDFKPWLDA
ncbi:MAG: LytTR family transcriptional regulator DNA-binding domain-containing protein [Bacteroidetes bacterium]|nr:LytTR family transcriptional regulator DNA-binding domain-containing protein [Bacteroidota bacterium]